MSSPLKRAVKLAIIQLATGNDKSANLQRASEKIAEAAKEGAEIVALPECFNSPYGVEHFRNYAEPIPNAGASYPPSSTPSYNTLSALATRHKIYLIGGSIPELDPVTSKVYNTCMIFSPSGELLATHRKIHLFDMHIPGKITFFESHALSPGATPTLVDTAFGKLGVAICHDLRFPELAAIAARRGAFLMVYPAAFNMATGPLHFEMLARARALDNQIYVAMCAPARNVSGEGYITWAHSCIVDPNAEVLAGIKEEEGMIECWLEPDRIEEMRIRIPVTRQRRFDVYTDVAEVEGVER